MGSAERRNKSKSKKRKCYIITKGICYVLTKGICMA